MNLRATGYIPDPSGHMRTPFRSESHTPPVASASLAAAGLAAIKRHFDQGQTGSCTGHSLAATIATAFAAAGIPLPFIPSPTGIYTNGRCVDRSSVRVPLEDGGAMPNQVVRGVAEWGIRPMVELIGRWSDADSTINPATGSAFVNDEPKLEDIATSLKTLIVGERAIYSTGAQRALDVKTAIANGFPVAVAVNGGCDAFQNYTGEILTGTALAGQLDHYVWLSAFDGDHFMLWNSWSDDWGIHGDAVLDLSALDTLGDLYVIIPKKAA